MNTTKFFLRFLLPLILLTLQVGPALAAPAAQSSLPIRGLVQSITLETDPTTGVVTVLAVVSGEEQVLQSVRVSLETGLALGLIILNGDGKPEINTMALGKPAEINQTKAIPAREENEHPVASALATFFAEIEGIDYQTIMVAHEQGMGFGLIAQALWLTTRLDGDVETYNALVIARQTGDYSAFVLEDGSAPENWGQLRKAILDSEKHISVGPPASNPVGDGSPGNGQPDKNKEKDDHGSNHGNQTAKDKEKNKDKEKDK